MGESKCLYGWKAEIVFPQDIRTSMCLPACLYLNHPEPWMPSRAPKSSKVPSASTTFTLFANTLRVVKVEKG
jgi:hypothetical protein